MPVKQRHGRLLKAYLRLAYAAGLHVVKHPQGWEITLQESGAKHVCETAAALIIYIKAYTEENNGEES